MTKNDRRHEASLFATFKSVLAAFIGVQSDKNRQRDFAQGQFWHFAVMGVVATVLFIGLVWGAVKLLLASSA